LILVGAENEHQNVGGHVALEVSDGNEDSIGNWTRGHLCYIVAKNLSTFCLCPKGLWETEF
jgi:hypothetical protein